jgi:hypothetical protein
MVLRQASQSLRELAGIDDIERAAASDLAGREDAHDEFQCSVHGAMIARAVSQVLA